MYGGDEVSAVVLDVGSHTVKAGFAGEDTPKAVYPSVVGVISRDGGGDTEMKEADAKEGAKAQAAKARDLYVGHTNLMYRRDDMEVMPALKDGMIADWELVESLWDHAMKDRLIIDPKEHPILLTEPVFNTRELREKAVEVMFEKNNCPALFLGKAPVLTSFSCGRATSLVVDCGAAGTTVSAVHDGYALAKSVVRSPLGGDVLTTCLGKVLDSQGKVIRPKYSIKRVENSAGEFEVKDLSAPGTTETFKAFHRGLVVGDVKEALCRASENLFDEEANANIPTVSYELPDGQDVHLGPERFKVPEVLFNPAALAAFEGLGELKGPGGAPLKGLAGMSMDAVNACDVDLRKELYAGVLLTGGTSVFPNVKERLERELTEQAPGGARVKVITSTSPAERRYSAWIGGSILASLGSFQQMWMSKAEYEEHGAALIHRKSP